MMEQLQEKAEKLAAKSSWVRKGLQEFLEVWCQSTKSIAAEGGTIELRLDDAPLFADETREAEGIGRLVLIFGKSCIFEEFRGLGYKEHEALDVDLYDFEKMWRIRKVVRALPQAMEKAEKMIDSKINWNEACLAGLREIIDGKYEEVKK